VNAPALEAKYEITLDDVHAFNAHYGKTSPVARRARRTARFGLTAMLAVLLGALGYGIRAPLPFWILGGAILLVFFAIFPRRVERLIRLHTARSYADGANKGLLGPHRLTALKDWLIEQSKWREQRTHWRAVERVEQSPHHLFIYVSGFTAIVIPRRAFDSDGDWTTFCAQIEERRHHASPEP
jgi:hypothetical protein